MEACVLAVLHRLQSTVGRSCLGNEPSTHLLRDPFRLMLHSIQTECLRAIRQGKIRKLLPILSYLTDNLILRRMGTGGVEKPSRAYYEIAGAADLFSESKDQSRLPILRPYSMLIFNFGS